MNREGGGVAPMNREGWGRGTCEQGGLWEGHL